MPSLQRIAAATALVAASCCACLASVACEKPAGYGIETTHALPSSQQQVWAVAPAINLSGQQGVDSLLQADLLFTELQTVRGLRAIPVNRVAQVYAALGIRQIESGETAAQVCALLGADALVVPTVTLYDPYDPPKMGAAVQIFTAAGVTLQPGQMLDARTVQQWQRSGTEPGGLAMNRPTWNGELLQEAGLFDAAHGTTRMSALYYVDGRTDPHGAARDDSVFLDMDRYARFVYHELLGDVMFTLRQQQRDNARATAGAQVAQQ